MERIREIIVAEGRDDEAALKRAVSAGVIVTHGYGISAETIALIEKAYKEKGIIIFTDPDHAGGEIRRKLTQLFPGAKQAYLSRPEAERRGDIGIENAEPEAIIRALERALATPEAAPEAPIAREELAELGLAGGEGAMSLREEVGKRLGIGAGNAAAFVKRLNEFAISREELRKAWEDSCQQRR
ncbi:MAG: ribonuclease M5 [Firmicutes bacterium]|nr:ribonuclease M5 [Bacillota bacterium]